MEFLLWNNLLGLGVHGDCGIFYFLGVEVLDSGGGTVVAAVDAPRGFTRHMWGAILDLAAGVNVAWVILILGIDEPYGYY